MDGRPNGRSFGRGPRQNYSNHDGHFRDGPRAYQKERYDRGRAMHGHPRPDYGPPMGQAYHDPLCSRAMHNSLQASNGLSGRPGPAAPPPGMGPYPGRALPMGMPPAQGPPPLRPHYDPWLAPGPALAPAMPAPSQYEVPGHRMWGANLAPQALPPHLQGPPAPLHEPVQAPPPWLQPEEHMLPPLPPSDPDAPPPPPDDALPPASGGPHRPELPPQPDGVQAGGQPRGDAAMPVFLAAERIPTVEMADIDLNAPQTGGRQAAAGDAPLQPSPMLGLSQEQASQATPSPGPFKMELKAKATPSPLQKNALRVVKGNPSLVAGIQRRMSNLCPRAAGQESPSLVPAQKPAGSSAAPPSDNGRLAFSRTPPWLASGVESAAAAGPQQVTLSAADSTGLLATAPSLPAAQEAAHEQARAAQNGPKAASNHQSDRSSTPDSRSSSSTQSSDSSGSRSSASRSSSRESSESAGQRGYRSSRRSPDRGPRSRSQWREEHHREPSRERLKHRDWDRDRNRGRDRDWKRDEYRDRGRDRSRERHRDPYGDRYRVERHPRDHDRHWERPLREYEQASLHGRQRDDHRSPERAQPLSSERAHAPSRLQSMTPEPRADHHRPRRPTPGQVEGATPPPPPPDEPDLKHAASQQEAIFIQRMNDSITGRITTLAADYGVDFAAADQDDVRGLDRLLISRVYPEQPDFAAWDAVDNAFARLEEEGEHGGTHSADALSNLQLGPKPVPCEEREQPEDYLCPLDVPWSPKAKPPADPRPQPEPGEMPVEASPMSLALPTFAIFPENEEKDWDEDSVLSWSDTPRRHGTTDEATSAPFAPAGADMMQAPAAPQHELMVQEDGRDWALEQMAQAAAPSAAASADPSAQQTLFEDISADVEEWSWIERRKDTVQLNSSKHSLQDLSGFAREGRRGVCPGACVFRHRDQLWIPLTERGFAAKELEWVREEDVPDAQGSACPYTAAVTAAAGMSEQALAQWMDSFPADGHPELPPPSVTQQDKAMMPPNLDVEGGEADSSSSESTQQWFDTFSLSQDPAAAAQARAQANAAAAEESFATGQAGACAVERRGVWGPRPPPQHGALLAGRLVLAAVGAAEGRTLVADLIQRALRKVREERQDELNARRQARQAQQAKHDEKRGPPVGTASDAKAEAPGRSQQDNRKRKHEQELPSSHGGQDQQRAAQVQSAVKQEPSKKVGAALDDPAAVSRQQKILSAAVVPEAMRLEIAAQQTAAAGADEAPGNTAEKARVQPAGRQAKPGALKRKVLQLDDLSDDDVGREPKQATPIKAAKRAKSSTPGTAARAHAAKTAGPDAEGEVEEEAEREHRKMREAAEKAQENSRHDAMKNAMLQAIRALIQFDGKELSQLFLKPATGFEGYTDVIKNPICLLDIMNKHQKQQQYPLNRDGFDMITADLKLMCDNCHTFNEGNQDLQESANLMWSEATKQLEAHYQKALGEIASLMSGQRTR